MVKRLADAKLYVSIVHGKKYMYLNYYDTQARRVKHLYVGSPYIAAKQLQYLTRILDHWDKLDPTSRKIFLEAIAEVEAQLNQIKSRIMT